MTTAAGYQLDAGEAVSMDLYQGGALYAITASGTQPVHVLQAGAV